MRLVVVYMSKRKLQQIQIMIAAPKILWAEPFHTIMTYKRLVINSNQRGARIGYVY